MFKTLPATLLGVLLSCAVTAQCDLTAEATNFTCDPAAGGYTFNLVVTGSDSTVRMPLIGLEFPLPFEETFFVPVPSDEFVLELESGTGTDLCFASVTLTPPNDCTPEAPNCFVSIQGDDLNCGTPGQLTAIPTGVGPFSYSWNTGDTTATIPFGDPWLDYAVTITDAEGCTAQTSRFFGGAHPFFIHIESSGNPCIEGQEANITASVFGGQPPYSFLWDTGDTTETLSNVMPEVLYTVTVTDANGCTGTAQGLYHPGAFAQHLQIEGPTTTNCDDTPITLSVTDPNPDFEYRWEVGNDTLFGASITTTTGGVFFVTGFNPSTPACQAFGSYQVTEVNFSEKDLAIVSFGHPCEEGACVALVNTSNGFTLLEQIDVTWSSATTTVADHGLGFVCLEEPADYEAVITSPCDTVTLDFTVEADPVCTQVCGSIVLDMDQDCIPDEAAHDWTQTVVILTNDATNLSYPIHPNADGTFCAELPKGGYTIWTIGEGMTLSTDCEQVQTQMEITLDNEGSMELFVSAAEPADNETTSTVAGATSTEFALSVFPNPSNGSLSFNFTDQRMLPTDVLTLYDGLGRRVEQTNVGALPQPWVPRRTVSGVYQLILTDQRGALKARTAVVFRK